MTNTNELDRAEAASSLFDKLEISTQDPKWSSRVLERMLDAVVQAPQGKPTDLIRGFDLALKKYNVGLTQTLAYLVKDVVVLTFSKAGPLYQRADWQWANEELKAGVNPARCYLFLYALPRERASANAIAAILSGLAETPFLTHAVAELSDDLERADVKPLLHGVKMPA